MGSGWMRTKNFCENSKKKYIFFFFFWGGGGGGGSGRGGGGEGGGEGWGGQGRCEQRSEVFVKIKKKIVGEVLRLAPSADVFTISMCSTLLTFRMFTLSLASVRVMKGKKFVVCSLQFF